MDHPPANGRLQLPHNALPSWITQRPFHPWSKYIHARVRFVTRLGFVRFPLLSYSERRCPLTFRLDRKSLTHKIVLFGTPVSVLRSLLTPGSTHRARRVPSRTVTFSSPEQVPTLRKFSNLGIRRSAVIGAQSLTPFSVRGGRRRSVQRSECVQVV